MSTNLSDIIDLRHAGTIPAQSANYLIFFITGNPGLIEYYRVFLSRLYSSLSSSPSLRNARIRVFGRSLSGFDVGRSQDGAAARGRARGAPYGLQEQIDGVERALWEVVAQEGGDVPRVVLVGHSVGAYILLELVRRCRGDVRGGGGQEVGAEGKMRIVGGVCLFPTVTHIARSRSGRKFSTIFKLPLLPSVAAALVKLLTFWLPAKLLQSLVESVTGFPRDAAATTAAFVKSPRGVWQALHMARDEMTTITHDSWDAEIWGAASSPPGQPRPKLFFYFGQDDHWVADATRDELISVRAYRGDKSELWRPTMEIDSRGVPHGFCIAHSAPVAEKVKGYIEEIIEADMRA